MSDDNKILLEKVREFEVRTGHTTDSWPDDDNNTASVLNEKRDLRKPQSAEDAKREMFARSRRGFLVGGAAALIGIFGWRWMDEEIKTNLLRRTFEFNEKVSQIFYRPTQLAKEFPPESVTAARINGDLGMPATFEPASWTLSVGGIAGRSDDLILSLDDIKKLPRTEMITELKCIEGWSPSFTGQACDSRILLQGTRQELLMVASRMSRVVRRIYCNTFLYLLRMKNITLAGICPASCIRKRCLHTK